ncbi:hypothetical protein BO82DRAFT_384049 [Aspergillus uvarum CBS 121591]|uniref:Zn(2)-C6 fungal-type domain-containing protein n=1 Tax=Aspergillus uvarum CBS 121591 TaxID=1448315 RepID=A0A319CB73_9EURO|nr:hypothetical protein BO82DRAFT_384049 [Aspergillus uvarum CBS 121591]PYH81061.1 hypothetical protein BO82DRAFT_384049 [Aspergillus uvarum CBS 121591]
MFFGSGSCQRLPVLISICLILWHTNLDPSITPYTRTQARKTHRKSRLSCRNCKRRRIKCDEIRPHCTNCVRHAVECDYSLPPKNSASSTEWSSPSSSAVLEQRDVSYTYITSTPTNFKSPIRAYSRPHASAQPTQQQPIPPSDEIAKRPFQFTVTDMALFHHLCRLGFSHHYVLHILLALSGFNLVRESNGFPWNRYIGTQEDFLAEADSHLHTAVQEITALTSQLNSENAPAIYTSAVFIFLCSLAKGPEPGEYLAFRDDGESGYLGLFLGVRSILEFCQNELPIDVCYLGRGRPKSRRGCRECARAGRHPRYQRSIRPDGYDSQCTMLHDLVSPNIPETDPRSSSYHRMLGQLHYSLHAVLGPGPRAAGMSLFPLIFSWLEQLPDDLVQDLQYREPIALILFAFFAVLLNQLDQAGVYCHLDLAYQPFIQWPVDQMLVGGLAHVVETGENWPSVI